MLEKVEQTTDYSDSDSDNDSLRTDDVKAITDSDDETEEETLLREALEKINTEIKQLENKTQIYPNDIFFFKKRS